jgi:predicted dehydrogenase
MDQRERELRRRARDDFEFYAPRALWIRPKKGRPVRFRLNKAQRYIHSRMEAQRAEIGRVRCLILKGRQQGASTYTAGRFYWRVSHGRGLKAFILTHEISATNNLFEMVGRYHANNLPILKPETGKSSEKELTFPNLDSGYKVGTAGNKATGRSLTAQLFHGSEVAFWQNAEELASGVIEAVPEEDGTEIVLESTAKGVGNYFHKMWRGAERGENGFIPIFVPWFWQDEYRRTPPADFELSTIEDEFGESEASYAEAHGLDDAQMFWRRVKIARLGLVKFKEEYPATPGEAFQMSGHESFIKAPLVLRARKNTIENPIGPLVAGFDPAWKTGLDGSALALRRGRKLLSVERKLGLDTMGSVGWILTTFARYPDLRKLFLDVGGLGLGVYDRLNELGWAEDGDGPNQGKVVAVNFAGSPRMRQRFCEVTGEELPGPYNRRAEIWLDSRNWLEQEGGVDIPDDDDLHADACAPGYNPNTSDGSLMLESKEQMRKRNVKSPDKWDATALTFAEPVINAEPVSRSRSSGGARHGGGWMRS